MSQTVKIFDFLTGQFINVKLYETDTFDIFKKRIQCTADIDYPQNVLFTTNFPNHLFVLAKETERKDYGILPLHILLKRTKNFQELPLLYNKFKTTFHLSVFTFLEEWLFFHLPDIKDEHQNRWEAVLFSMKTNWEPEYIQSFQDALIMPDTKKKIHRKDFQKWLNREWFIRKKKNDNTIKEKIIQDVKYADEIAIEFTALPVQPVLDVQEKGQVLSVEIHNKFLTTGILFQSCTLSSEFPACHYKTFFKIYYTKDKTEIKENIDPTIPSGMTEFYSLRLMDKEGNCIVFIRNESYGVWIQCVIGMQSPFKTLKDVLTIFRIDEKNVKKETSGGLFIQFDINNPAPKKMNPLEWNPLDPVLFSNLCMNNTLVRKFFMVNDTDKITRTNNSSLFLYFSAPFYSLPDEKSVSPTEEIYIGGWNRSISRFGDLTAIINCYESNDEFRISVRITRSRDQNIIEQFYTFLGKFVSLYNREFTNLVKLFQTFIPHFKISFVPSVALTKIEDELKAIEPSMFPSNVYSTVCQKKAKPKILEKKELDIMLTQKQITDSQYIVFPEPEMKSAYSSRIYACTNKENGFVYPGFVEMSKDTGHPFGFAPCCFKEDHSEKNKNRIRKYIQDKINAEKKINVPEPIHFMKYKYIIASDKKIDQTGQLGVLPDSLHSILVSVFEPFGNFYRIGMPPRWNHFSVLTCLDYYDAVKNRKASEFRPPRDILNEMTKNLNTNMLRQECYDLSDKEILDYLKDPKDLFFNPRRYWRLLEMYFRITLVIFSKNSNNVIEMVRPYSFGNYYYFINPEKPIVCLYQHFGGTRMLTEKSIKEMNPYYELIGYSDMTKDSDTLLLDFRMNPSIQEFMKYTYMGYDNFYKNVPIFINTSRLQLSELKSQFIDCAGKTRILFYTELHLPFFTEDHALPPLKLSLQTPDNYFFKDVFHLKDIYSITKDLNIIKGEIYNYDNNDTGFMSIMIRDMVMLRLVFRCKINNIIKYWPRLYPDISLTDTQAMPIVLLRFIDLFPYINNELNSYALTRFDTIQLLVDIIQDYLLIRLSDFIQTDEIETAIAKLSADKIIELFLSIHIQWSGQKLPYKDIKLSPLVSENKFLFSPSQKMIIPENMKSKIFFFLKWFLLNNEHSLLKMKSFKELPSFYQNAYSFSYQQKNVCIQLTLQPVSFPKGCENFYKIPIVQLFEKEIPIHQLFYYYYPKETPENTPYLCFRYEKIQYAESQIVHIETHHSISPFEKLNTALYKKPKYSIWNWETNQWTIESTKKSCAIAELLGIFEEDTIIILFIPIHLIYT